MLRSLAVGFLVVLVAACDGTRTPTTSSPTPPPVTPLTLTGVVYEYTAEGRRPLAGAAIDVSAEYQSYSPKVFSDAEGRYTAADLTSLRDDWKVVAQKAGYRQPCRTRLSHTTVDLHVVSEAILSTTGIPRSFPITQPTLSGRVVEATPEGRRPVSGVSVVGDFSGGNGWGPAALTMTDSDGGYVLCGLDEPLVLGLALYVSNTGYQPVYPFILHPGGTKNFDIELSRQ
jgi:hypothetical protein